MEALEGWRANRPRLDRPSGIAGLDHPHPAHVVEPVLSAHQRLGVDRQHVVQGLPVADAAAFSHAGFFLRATAASQLPDDA